jgi:methionyl-tRNA formyltransferase
MNRLRIVFMGTPVLACASLRGLLAVPEFEVCTVVTQPDRPKGRQMHLQPSPVKELALAHGAPVLQPERARDPAFCEALRQVAPDLIAVTAFGQILPQSILDLPRFGCLNVHTSLLPKYRGAAPIQWALLNGDRETGATIMKMNAGMDTGDIVVCESIPITSQDTAATLHDRLAELGGSLLARSIPGYVAGTTIPVPQPKDGVSYAPKIKKEDGHVDWRQPARVLWNRSRAFTPWPGLFTHLGGEHPRLLKLWEVEVTEVVGPPGRILSVGKSGIVVACGEGGLNLKSLQIEGGRRLAAAEFLAGHQLQPGSNLGELPPG